MQIFTAHVDEKLAEQLRERAEQTDRSIAAEIRCALRAHLADNGGETEATSRLATG